jgi:IS1 family transposase
VEEDKVVKVVRLFIEGNGIRGIARYLYMEPIRVRQVLLSVGLACSILHNQYVRGLKLNYLQMDELWSFIGAKDKTLRRLHASGTPIRGDQRGSIWTVLAVHPPSMLIVSYLAGCRKYGFIERFITDLRSRLVGRPTLVSDGYQAYEFAIGRVFGEDSVDYGKVVKIRDNRGRYLGSKKEVVFGCVEEPLITTTYIECTNLHHRMKIRRMQRDTTGHSKQALAHFAALALWAAHHDFVHQPDRLRKATPAMVAGIASEPWSVDRLILTAFSLMTIGENPF